MLKLRLALFAFTLLSLWLLHLSHAPFIRAMGQEASVANLNERARGLEMYKQGKFQEAEKLFRTVVEKNSSDEEGWYYLGLSLMQQPNEVTRATKAFKTALKLRPNFAAAHVELGYIFLLRNKPYDAMSEAETALRIDPKIPDAQYILGATRLRAGATAEALKHAETIIKLDPQFSSAYLLKSQALLSFLGDRPSVKQKESPETEKGRYREAAEALEKYLQLDPNAKEKQTWTEQLESLRFHIAIPREGDAPDRVYSGTELTKKARVLDMPPPELTEAARNNQVKGSVVLRCILASDGSARHIIVVKGLPHGLTERAIKAASLIKFVPATIDGRPVSMFIQLEYNFNLY
jgi:tetratricopeptide (TPR) repeat protein